MATLPSASTTVSETAGAIGAGTDLVCIWSPQPTLADSTPRQYGSAKAVYEAHGYGPGVEYAAVHAQRTGKPFLFCALPIATAGAVGRQNTSGNTGTSTTTVAAGGDGVLHEHDGVIAVVTGGTIGTDQIVLSVSLDGGRSTKRMRLGTGSSLALPYVGVTGSFGAGTLVAGDTIHTWHGTGPRSDSSGWALARAAMAAQQKQVRSIMLCGDLQNSTEANAYETQLAAYETSNDRFVLGRGSVLDRLPLASMSSTTHGMTGAPALTFAEVGATGDTITRAAGSWLADGFAAGDLITIAGSSSNDGTTAAGIASLTATVITLDTDDLTDEVGATGVTVIGAYSLTFSDSADTITRSRGSWLDDGFRVGDSVTIAASQSNNGTFTVTAVTATVLTLESTDLSDEVDSIADVTISAGQTKAVWMAAIDAAFAAVDDKFRIDLSAGRARVLSPFSNWLHRQAAGWFASWREFAHDVHVATWRKADGPVNGDLFDADGNLVEWDDRVDGGAGSAARFTALRTWANGPNGAFVAQSLTRGDDDSLLSRTHNVAVVNVAQTVCQAATEAVIGRSLVLNTDGTATTESLNTIKLEVNAALEQALLTNQQGEGQRASGAVWTPATDDDLSVAEPTLNGTLALNLRGTIHTVVTVVRVGSQ